MTTFPKVRIVEEAMREGMQIEGASIPTHDKIRLLDAISRTGLREIVVGSFVSPKWVPQMAAIDEIVEGFTPAPGVTYTALALNRRGVERATAYEPKITTESAEIGVTRVHLCDVFVQRNTGRTRQQEIDAIPEVIEAALANRVQRAMICINAAWGSNWLGEFSEEERTSLLRIQYEAWAAAGVPVTAVWIGDPMSWNAPGAVRRQLMTIMAEWPQITTFHLHLHNGRGMAPLSAYEALNVLDERHELAVDTALGGLGGCPYCGNGRFTRMIPTEDFVELLHSEGIQTGVDVPALVEAVILAEAVVGHELWGHVSKIGARPHGEELYAMDMPFVETLEQAQHFRLGSSVYEGGIHPWQGEIISVARNRLGLSKDDDHGKEVRG